MGWGVPLGLIGIIRFFSVCDEQAGPAVWTNVVQVNGIWE